MQLPWCQKRPERPISLPNTIDRLEDRTLVPGGHFGKFSSGEQQRPETRRSQRSTFAHYDEAIEHSHFE